MSSLTEFIEMVEAMVLDQLEADGSYHDRDLVGALMAVLDESLNDQSEPSLLISLMAEMPEVLDEPIFKTILIRDVVVLALNGRIGSLILASLRTKLAELGEGGFDGRMGPRR